MISGPTGLFIMHLPLFNRKKQDKYFLSIVISEGTVASALWGVGSGGPKVLKTSSAVVWNSDAESSLIEASDVALEELGSQANTVKDVLLGLPEQWAQHQSIANDKKHLLKKLTDQLNLKSVGFVITQEAIAALFRDREHTGCNALLVYVSQKNVYLLSILHGKASQSVHVGRSDSLVNDIIEGCARGSLSSLPARILLASQDLTEAEMTATHHELESHVWDEKLFVHTPRVDTVSAHLILEAVSVAGGKEVARALGILDEKNQSETIVAPQEKSSPDKKSDAFGFTPVDQNEEAQETDEDGEDGSEEEVDEERDPDAPLDFGIDKPLARRFPIPPRITVIALVVLVLIFALFGTVYAGIRALAQTNISVVIKTEPVSFDTTMTIDANASHTDPENNILKAELRTKEVTDTGDAITTGSKLIGDKAVGSVVIYNRTTVGDKTFKAGTVLKLDDKTQFTLDADITVPVGTADNEYVGKASGKVTAAAIGAESNIDQGVELTVGGFDKASFVAKTEAKFTGGSSRTIQVVSEDDQKKLGDKLYAQLKEKALAAFNQESQPHEHIILSDKVTVTKRQFSDDIGKEVKSFTLTMTVNATAIVYTNDDISAFATQKLASQIPAGSQLKSDRTVIEVTNSETVSDTKTVVAAKISSVIIPAFDEDQIAAVLAGNSVEEARTFLDSQHAIGSYELTFSPGFASGMLQRLPTQTNRIHIESTVE